MLKRFDVLALVVLVAALFALQPSSEPELEAVTRDGFVLSLEVLPKRFVEKGPRVRLALHNSNKESRDVPGSFCRQVPWDHVVEIHATAGDESWVLTPGYAEKGCHPHDPRTLSMGPDARMTNDFTLTKWREKASSRRLDQLLYKDELEHPLRLVAVISTPEGEIRSESATWRKR